MKRGKALKKKAGKLQPRVGKRHQANIPSLTEKCDHSQLVNRPVVDSDAMIDQSNSSSLELPIPGMRGNCKVDNIDRDTEFGYNEERMVLLENENQEPLKTVLGKNLLPLLGSLEKPWTGIELDSFLLGLYIFGKNFNIVKKFVGSKEMGGIQHYYYGKFYNSDPYLRWSECRKLKDRHYGKSIFAGSRKQKVLSRLFPRVSKDNEDLLIESHTNFSDEKISFEDYVFALKDIVGTTVLMEAIGIKGRRKKLRNLTGSTMEPIKSSNKLSVESETPFGKAYSALTSAEIIKFLTGDFKLSKAQSKDLFWKAVWPRLLARGWHNERLKNHKSLGLKHSLVFLAYRVARFSSELVKGKHYFNSVGDLLKKVASRPMLLESNKKQAEKLVQNGWSSSNQDVMKYTVVDTSKLDEAAQPKLRKHTSLPVQIVRVDTPSAVSVKNEHNESEKSEDEEEEIESLCPKENKRESGTCFGSSNCEISILNTSNPYGAEAVMEAAKNHESQRTVSLDDTSPRTSPFCKRNTSKNLNVHFSRMRDLTAFDHEKSSCSIENISVEIKQMEDDLNLQANLAHASEDIEVQIGSQISSAVSSLAKDGGSDWSNKDNFADNPLDGEVTSVGSTPRILIDLNLLYIPQDLETESNTDTIQINDNSPVRRPLIDLNLPCVSPDLKTGIDRMNGTSSPSETSQHPDQLNVTENAVSKDEQPMPNGRRQSTRSRLMTKRVLESLEHEFFNTKIRKKDAEFSQNNSFSRPRAFSGTAADSVLDEAHNDMTESRKKDKN